MHQKKSTLTQVSCIFAQFTRAGDNNMPLETCSFRSKKLKKIGIYAMFIFMLGLYLHIHSCMLIFFFQLLVEFTDCVSNFQGAIKYLSPLIEKKQRQIFFSIYLWMSKKLRRPPKLMIPAHQCLFQQRNEERKGNGNTK